MFGQFGFAAPGVVELDGGAVVDGDALVDGEAVLEGEAPMSGETLGDGDAAAWAITNVPNPPAKPTPTAKATFATELRAHPSVLNAGSPPHGDAMTDRR